MNLTPEQYRILFGDSPPEDESRPAFLDAKRVVPDQQVPTPKPTFDVPPQVRNPRASEYNVSVEEQPPSTALVLVPSIPAPPEPRRPRAAEVLIALALFAALVASPFVLDRLNDDPEAEVLSEAVVAVEPSLAEPLETEPVGPSDEPSVAISELEGQRALVALANATVLPVDQVASGFNPNDYFAGSWPDSDGDCQSDREEVLIDRSIVDVGLDIDGCRVIVGRWIDPFTSQFLTDAAEIRVIRTVPLEIADQTGAADWTSAQQRAFAVDAAFEASLRVVAVNTADERGDRGPDEWQPEPALQCAYAVDWVSVKTRWNLAYTAQELEALQNMLTTCGS